ncbi:hypothetical protein DLM45_04015 [Hyphomicrobium methylovorum]|nr:hypothetical protein [Hyphomicrobium methylovorum]
MTNDASHKMAAGDVNVERWAIAVLYAGQILFQIIADLGPIRDAQTYANGRPGSADPASRAC